MDEIRKKTFEKYPFLSLVKYNDQEYVGIIQNCDETLSIYDYGRINDANQKNRFLSLGNIWWWESNRQLPINIFLKQEWHEFNGILVHLISKYCDILHGQTVNIRENKKKSKTKNIQLVRKMD